MIPAMRLDLPAQRVVEAVDRRGARLQDRVAEPADERHRGDPARLCLGIERRSVLLDDRLLDERLRDLGGSSSVLPFLGHGGRV